MSDEQQVPDFKVLINGSPLPEGLAPHLLRIEVQQSLRLIDMAVLTLSNPEGLIADSSELDQGNELEVKGGYLGAVTSLFKGEIVSLEPDFPTSGNPTVVVRAYDKLARLRRGRQQRTFLNQSVADVVRALANEEGLTPDVEDTGGPVPWLLQTNQSNIDYIHELGRIHGYEVTLTEGATKLRFKKPEHSGGSDITLEWGEELKAFYPRASVNNTTSKVVVRCWDPGSKQAIIENSEAPLAAMGSTTVVADKAKSAFGEAKLQVSLRLATDPNEAKALANAIHQERALDAVQGHGNCMGNPALVPGKVIELLGCGKLWSGRYYVVGATHLLDPNAGYVTEFRVKRTGLGYQVESRPIDPPPPEQAEEEEQTETFVELKVVSDGADYAGTPYKITLPDGSVQQGELDETGVVRVEGIRDSGDVKVELEVKPGQVVPEPPEGS